jgi:GTPase SAR1 family protein
LILKDIAGGDRQRVFWRHHYSGTQGVIFFVDITDSPERLKEAGKVIFYNKYLP